MQLNLCTGRRWLALAGLLLSATAQGADLAGASDHPLVDRYPGAEIIGYAHTAEGALTLPMGHQLVTPAGAPVLAESEVLQGEVTRILYRLDGNEGSPLEVFRSYQLALYKAGFETRFSCHGWDCGRDFSRLANPPGHDLVENAMSGYLSADMHFMALRRQQGGRATYASLFVGRHEAPRDRLAGDTLIQLNFAEDAHPRPPAADEVQDVAALQAGLEADGRVVVEGIEFPGETHKPTGDSMAAMDRVVALMEQNPEMAVVIVAHADNRSSHKFAMSLTMKRAVAVGQYVIEHLPRGRAVEVEGAGFLAPLASNASEYGRRLNNRVELVKMNP